MTGDKRFNPMPDWDEIRRWIQTVALVILAVIFILLCCGGCGGIDTPPWSSRDIETFEAHEVDYVPLFKKEF